MRQFDVCELAGSGQLVVILQSDMADELDTRIVAPLSDRPYRQVITGIRIPIDFDDSRLTIQLDRMAAIHRKEIARKVGSLTADERRIKRGLDMIFFGV